MKQTPEFSAMAAGIGQSAAVRVVYIAGWGRSGSTLLDNVLHQVDGCFSVGELRYLFRRGLVENRYCGDGIAFRDHPFWQEVIRRAFGGPLDPDQVRHYLQLEATALGSFNLARLALGRPPVTGPAVVAYQQALARLYRAVQAVSGCRLVVDSSKNPLYGYWLAGCGAVDLQPLHLVRDPRAVAFSWLRHKVQPDRGPQGALMQRKGIARSALQWAVANRAAEQLCRQRGPRALPPLRYEDFAARPREVLQDLLERLELTDAPNPVAPDSRIDLGGQVAFSGNPSRFRSGPITIRRDEQWRNGMDGRQQWLIRTLDGALMRRYGYRNGPP